jgi:hypothetical protein
MRPVEPEHYFRAALERMRQSQFLYRKGDSYSLAMYVAGVAAESLLRAFKGRRNKTFDEKHNLKRLFEAGLLMLTSADFPRHAVSNDEIRSYKRDLQAAIHEIHLLWSNDYRFASEARLRNHLKKLEAFRKGMKGDILKAYAWKLLNATQRIIDRGNILWELL